MCPPQKMALDKLNVEKTYAQNFLGESLKFKWILLDKQNMDSTIITVLFANI